MSKISLKQLSTLVIILAIILAFSGCGQKNAPITDNENHETATSTDESETSTEDTATSTDENTGGDIPTSTDEIDTSDWKVYRNEEYGFELRYPDDELYIKTEDNASEIHFYGKENCSDIASPMSPPGPKCMNINISVKKLLKNIISLDDLISNEKINLAPKNERIKINNREVIISEAYLENGYPFAIDAVMLGDNYYYEIKMGGQYFLVTEESKNKFYKFLDNFKIL